jgi:hypothetical protein
MHQLMYASKSVKSPRISKTQLIFQYAHPSKTIPTMSLKIRSGFPMFFFIMFSLDIKIFIDKFIEDEK